MNTRKQEQISKQALNTWGESAQIKQTKEELEELIDALDDFENGKSSAKDVIEELADCDIMINQCKHIFDVDAFTTEKTKRLHQLETRLETGEWPTKAKGDTNE